MNVYISVDIEGISGVVHADMMMPGQSEYGRGRRLMTEDANAAIRGAFAAGAEYVLVSDGHGPMRNLLIEELDPRAHLMSGTADARPFCQLEGADERTFDAALFVGYHAMAKTPKAIHPHTIAGAVVHELRVDGVPHGETGLNAAVLASLGIPTVLVTGDGTTCAEATRMLGDGVETVAVKRATGMNAAVCRPLGDAHADIETAAARALGQTSSVTPYRSTGPFRIEVDFLRMPQCDRASRTAGVEQVGPVTIAIEGADPWSAYRTLWAALRSALYDPASFLA